MLVHFVTVEKVALCLQYLSHVAHPGLPDFGTCPLEDVPHRVPIGAPGRQCKLAWVAVHAVLKTQTAHLQDTNTNRQTHTVISERGYLFLI